uniref:G-protein coupled receptors family 1 profile domain-containing protein n=1 Tax=Strigamia maritima TaxID=126957 RepID=T1JCM2_STRMM
MVVNETLNSVAACCHLTTSSSRVNGSASAAQHGSDANDNANANGSSVAEWVLTELAMTLVNSTLLDNGSLSNEWVFNETGEQEDGPEASGGYWALILVLFPIFAVFGNVLVILSVYKERGLRTVTNYFIVSLAVADLLVAALVMPFAVYVL